MKRPEHVLKYSADYTSLCDLKKFGMNQRNKQLKRIHQAGRRAVKQILIHKKDTLISDSGQVGPPAPFYFYLIKNILSGH